MQLRCSVTTFLTRLWLVNFFESLLRLRAGDKHRSFSSKTASLLGRKSCALNQPFLHLVLFHLINFFFEHWHLAVVVSIQLEIHPHTQFCCPSCRPHERSRPHARSGPAQGRQNVSRHV